MEATVGPPADDREEEPSPFAAWIRRKLSQRGWSIVEFSRISSIPEATVGAWVRDTRTPSTKYITNIARALEIPESRVLQIIEKDYDWLFPGYLEAQEPEQLQRIAVFLTMFPEREELVGEDRERLFKLLDQALQLVYDVTHVLHDRNSRPTEGA